MDKPLILSIDDDPDVLSFMQTVLETKGYQVATADSSEDGLRVLKEKTPALIFVDLMMEEVDAGTTFVKELKAQGRDVPIYMLSSVGDALNITTNFSELGLKGVLQKPIEPEALVKIVEGVIA